MLTFTCTTDGPDSNAYSLVGSVVDHDGHTVEVGEHSFNPMRAAKTLHYYLTEFVGAQVEFKTIVL
jgi:hypothetical protein